MPAVADAMIACARCGRERATPAVGLRPVTSPDQAPPEPWVADRIEVGAALHMDAMHWTGDWSRCIAWTWLDMLERSDDGGANEAAGPDAAAVDPDR